METDVIDVLIKLLKMFLIFFRQNSKDPLNLIDIDEEDIKLLKEELIQFLITKNYQKKDFTILKVETFDSLTDSKYLKSLLENLHYYLSQYEFKTIFKNFYYYLFHLIYFLLLVLSKLKDKNFLKDEIFKFYFFHIVHYFKNDKKNPEKYFFFYHGAFKLFNKKFAIPTQFVINFDLKEFQFSMQYTIQTIFDDYSLSLILKDEKNTEITKFIDDEQKILEEMKELKIKMFKKKNELFVNKIISDVNDNNNNLVQYFNHIHKYIQNVQKILNKYNLECLKLTKYCKLIEDFQNLIIKRGLTLNDLILMELNYNHKYGGTSNEFDIEKYIKYAQLFNECDQDSEVNYTNIFTKIINSEKFKNLYKTAMNSPFVQIFANDNNLTDKYNEFMKKFADKINEYILFVPLTRGMKAYVSNYMRICLNINSISISEYLSQDIQNEYFTSYLLIHLLHESFHFIFRLNEYGKSADKTTSPISKKIKEEYSEIGVDLILHLFGTEYITFISKENYVLLNNPKSWENKDTNFKVFNQIYLSDRKLVGKEEDEAILGSGLKCNISDSYETANHDEKEFRLCTSGSIKYCF